MNKKTKTYLLLTAVLGIWGTIAFKIVNGLSPDLPQSSEPVLDISFKPKTIKAIDTFSIQNVERDPFLGTLSASKTNNKPKETKNSNQIVTKHQPKITYSGLVKKQTTADKVFVVNINNQQYLLKQGQTADSVKLLRGNTKEITIRYKNQTKTINRD